MSRSLLHNDVMRFSVLRFRSDIRIELQAPVKKLAVKNYLLKENFTCPKEQMIHNDFSLDLTVLKPYTHINQWRSQNGEKVMHIKGRLLDHAVILFYCILFLKWELHLKERICSQRERILSFKGSSLWFGKSLLPH